MQASVGTWHELPITARRLAQWLRTINTPLVATTEAEPVLVTIGQTCYPGARYRSRYPETRTTYHANPEGTVSYGTEPVPQGKTRISEPRLYLLAEQSPPAVKRSSRIIFLETPDATHGWSGGLLSPTQDPRFYRSPEDRAATYARYHPFGTHIDFTQYPLVNLHLYDEPRYADLPRPTRTIKISYLNHVPDEATKQQLLAEEASRQPLVVGNPPKIWSANRREWIVR